MVPYLGGVEEEWLGGEGSGTLGVLVMFYSSLGLWLHKNVHFVKFIGLGTCDYILFYLSCISIEFT